MFTMLVPLVAGLALGAEVDEPRSLEREYLRVAQEVIKHCQDKGYANVGVLKFLVTKGDKSFSDNVGTLNLFLARKLEVALVLANNPRKPIGIIENASAVAHRTKGANHRTKEGRLKLFEPLYPLAWGKEEVKPDAFITGHAQVSDDLKTLTIQLLTFDKTENKLQPLLSSFKAANQPDQLAEMGESFNTRGLFDDSELETPPSPAREKERKDAVLHTAARVKDQRREGGQPPPPSPARDPKAPVTLEIRYDGRPVPVEVRSGKAFVPEPREGQNVELVIRRDDAPERYGVVLKVNGQNTIHKQRLPDLQCLRWILGKGEGPITVRGYQIDANTVERFRVLSVKESKEREIDYGSDVGTITVTVFRESKGKKRPPDPSDEAKEAAVVGKASLQTKPKDGEPEKPDTFNALTARLLDDANRGIIGEGPREPGAVQVVKFEPDPTPLMTLTIVYYHPQDLP